MVRVKTMRNKTKSSLLLKSMHSSESARFLSICFENCTCYCTLCAAGECNCNILTTISDGLEVYCHHTM